MLLNAAKSQVYNFYQGGGGEGEGKITLPPPPSRLGLTIQASCYHGPYQYRRW